MVRIATFNVENLFSRYRFAQGVDPQQAAATGFTSEALRHRIACPEEKHLTGQLITLLGADILALQEVEGMATLKRFRDLYLGGRTAYPHVLALEGNDTRGIEVGLLSRHAIVHVRSWQHLWDQEADLPLFSRDCLEVDVQVPQLGVITLFINHFKSMRDDSGDGGRARTRAVRVRQCQAVIDIVRARFGPHPGQYPWAILGDFNDYLAHDEQGRSGIEELVLWPELQNVVARLPADERWTHFFRGRADRGLAPTYQQLDYLLLSQRLARLNPLPPHIERRGQPGRASRHSGSRLEGVGLDRPKASDHCPIAMDFRSF